MRKLFTSTMVLCAFLSLSAQEELVKNGDFAVGDGTSTIAGTDHWNMDNAAPGSGVWDGVLGLTSGDNASVYQVIDVVSADSVLYDVYFNAYDSWMTSKVVVTASTSGADSSVRTTFDADTMDIGLNNYAWSFGFSAGSPLAGQSLIIELSNIPVEGEEGWTNIDNVSVIRRVPGVNNPPVCDPGAYQTVKGTETVTLDGSGSYDPDEDEITYTWVSTYPGIVLSDANAAMPTFVAPDVAELSSYSFALFVSDGEANSDTLLTWVTVLPAGELIRNNDFLMLADGADPDNIGIKDIAFWHIDEPRDSIDGGIAEDRIWLASYDSTLYQVVDVVSASETNYSLTFTGRSSWDCYSINTIFSVSDADSSIRMDIDIQENLTGINPDGGVNTSEATSYQHMFTIPANSNYVGKKLILEFDNIEFAGTESGWCELFTASLVKEEIVTSVQNQSTLSLNLYPNPVSSTIYIESDTRVTDVRVYNILGALEKVVYDEKINQINVDDLKSGLYIFSLTTKDGIINKKVQVK